MEADAHSADQEKKRRWRPTVAPYRPKGIPNIRAPKPLPGQMLLPGMEPLEEPELGSSQHAELDDRRELTTDSPSDPCIQKPEATSSSEASGEIRCPNCGASEFDGDGDCLKCWEPGVLQRNIESSNTTPGGDPSSDPSSDTE